MTMLFLLGLSLIGTSLMTLTATTSRLTDRGAQKVQATALAEAAVHEHYDAILRSLASDGNYPATIPLTEVYSNLNGRRQNDGAYSCRIVGTPGLFQLEVLNTLGIKVGLRITHTFVIEGEGVAPNSRTRSRVRATFSADQLRVGASVKTVGTAFISDAAIQSNTTVKMVTNGGIRVTDASGSQRAGILANTAVSWTTYSGAKSDFRNPNAVDADGQIMVPGAPNPAYTTTTGPSGMGNTNGTLNYRTRARSADEENPSVPLNSIMGMAAARQFADEAQVTAWKQQWEQEARSGTVITGNTTTNSIPPTFLIGERRITAPAYIDGDLNIDQGTVYLQPNADSSKPRIVYVRGDITNNGQLYNRGVILVSEGKYTGSQNSLYSLQTQYSLFSSLSTLYGKTGLVSLKKSSAAISLNSNASAAVGLVYAALGGMEIKGSAELRGALVSGGAGEEGGVLLSPANGASTVVWYEPNSVKDRTDFPVTTTTVNLGAVLSLTPTRLKNWSQTL